MKILSIIKKAIKYGGIILAVVEILEFAHDKIEAVNNKKQIKKTVENEN